MHDMKSEVAWLLSKNKFLFFLTLLDILGIFVINFLT